jgi:hypothetical protein
VIVIVVPSPSAAAMVMTCCSAKVYFSRHCT